MSKKYVLLNAFALLIATHTSFAYRKFCYTVHEYAHKQTATQQAFESAMECAIPFNKKGVSYVLHYPDEAARCYVQLDRADKYRIIKYLRALPAATPITSGMVQACKQSKKDAVLGWVLQDFKRQRANITAAEVLACLGEKL
jgi:hypothetical protein